MPHLCPPAPLRGLLVLVLCTCFAVGTPPCPFSIGSFLLGSTDDQRVVVLSIHFYLWHHTAVMVYLIPDLAITGGSDLLYIYICILSPYGPPKWKNPTPTYGFVSGVFQYQRKGCFSIRRMRTLSRSSHWTYEVRGWLQLASETV